MRISLLLQREPFGEILERTLANFLQSTTGQAHKVRWYPKNPGARTIAQDGYQPWFCNVYLNAIFSPDADQEVLNPVRREFSRSPVWWRRIPQRLYVQAATHPPLANRLAQAALGVSPSMHESRNWFIMGGNHRLRLFDRLNDRVYVVLKAGFAPTFITRELDVRRQAACLPIPPIDSVDENGTWFSERLVAGTPLNRIGGSQDGGEVPKGLLESLHRWVRMTSHETDIVAYSGHLADEARTYLSSNHLLSPEEKLTMTGWLGEVMALLKRLVSASGTTLITAQTHGDFQPSNILVNGNDAWIVDWEYTNRRQSAYDALVYALESRFPIGLASRIKEALLDNQGAGDQLLNTWPDLEWGNHKQRRITLVLFLIEEMVLYLEENHNPLFYSLSGGMKDYCGEMESALTVLRPI